MSEPDFKRRLGEELTAAARRQAERRRAGWRGRLGVARLGRGRGRGRALVLVGAVALLGAGGTAGLLAKRGDVGGPPSLTFARISPQQRAAGVRPLTRPVVFARGRLAYDGRPWQLVGFQTTRGLCIEIDFPRQDRAGGCGAPEPRGGKPIDWQAQIAIGRLARGIVIGAVDSRAEAVDVRHGTPRRGIRFKTPVPNARQPLVDPQVAHARVIHVRAPRLLAALGRRRPFAYWIAELNAPFDGMLASARSEDGSLLGRAGIPQAMNGTSIGISFQRRACYGHIDLGTTRVVSTMPPQAVRDRIAALRRPQRASDLPPRWFLDGLLRTPLHATVEVDAIRLLRRTPHGDPVYLLPTTERVPDMTPPPGCLRTLTPRQREREATIERRARAYAKRVHLATYVLGRRGGGGGGGFDLDAYRHGHAVYGSLGRELIGMAPDGVARVELRFRNGTRQRVPVVGNVWIATAPHSSEIARAVLWLAGDGRVLRRLR